MRIAVHGKPYENSLRGDVEEFFNLLKKNQFEIVVSEAFRPHLHDLGIDLGTYSNSEGLEGVSFMFTLGGDGTLLEAVTHVGPKEIPIIGLNMGRLGFLATIGMEKMDYAINQITEKKYSIDKRVLLRLEKGGEFFSGAPFALNDFTIVKKDTSSMIVVHTYVNNEFLNSYWADGLIISTPTGSTGYSLSCGGPLVLPQSSNFIINPVSPHNLSVRPMVLGDNSILSFKIEARIENVLVSLDSRSVTVPATTEFTIKKESFYACLVKFDGYHPFDTLRQKLLWGLDVRN
ncbi:MAG: NAD kinase [Bacteroidetes bacterium]|nr:MAG: NAD kinase [Bacteroidota bacterium]